jgi:uncharacterized protein YacL
MLLRLLRVSFAGLIVCLAVLGFGFFYSDVSPEYGGGVLAGLAAAAVALVAGGLVILADLREREQDITVLSALIFGLLLGLLLGWLFSLPIPAVIEAFANQLDTAQQHKLTLLCRTLVSAVCCYLTIATLLQTRDDFRFVIPYVEFSKQVKGNRPLVLDTSVIIDGRIADVCDTRLVDAKLIVPRFVLNELQGIADSSDKMKRNRGRRGLDVLKRLQGNPKIELVMHDGNAGEVRPGEKVRVDERLVLFAKAVGGRVVTNDFNLNKIAQLQGVDVINLNEVANALKTVALPGESLTVRLVKPGDQPMQGVGYLDDGTMVVVEMGRNSVGQEVAITVTSVLQTPAGRMIFGRLERPSGSFGPVTPQQQPGAVGGSPSGPHQPVRPGQQQNPGPEPPKA